MHAGAGCWQAGWLQESIFTALTGLTAAWHLAHQDLDNTWHLAHQDRTNRPLIPITPCTTPSPSPCHRSTREHNIREAQQSTSPPTAKTIPSVLPGLPANHILSFLAGNWCYQIKEMTKPQKTAESDRFGPDKEEELVFSFDLTIHCSRDEEKCPQGARLSLILTDVGFGTSSSFSSSNQLMLTFPYHFHQHVTIFY